jgi:flagellar motility protein MotE (MotC chaperone)
MSPQRQTGKPAGKTGQKPRSRLRLAPIVMIAVLATITVKANHLWHGLSISLGRPSEAQAANNQAGQQPAPTGAPTQLGAGQNAPNPATPNPTPANQAAGQTTPNQATPNQAAPNPTPAGQGATNQAATGQQTAPAQPTSAAQQTAQVQPPAPSGNQPATGQGAAAPAAGTDATGAANGQDLLAQDQQRKLARDPFNYTDEEVDVLQQLAKRRAELDERARQLDEREALIKAAEQRMDQKMAELKALQATVQDLLKQRNAADEAQLQSLVKIYENMKPKAAAQIFEEMDMDVLLDVVSRMNERKVSPILALVSPTRAKELTYELAERRQMPIPQ